MPKRLKRHYGAGHLHFITCSCYQRRPLLGWARARNLFVRILGEVRDRYRFALVGYVAMPDHVHLLMSEPAVGTPSVVMQVLKQRVSRRLRKSPSLRTAKDGAPNQLRLWGEKDNPTLCGAKGGAPTVARVGWSHLTLRGGGPSASFLRLAALAPFDKLRVCALLRQDLRSAPTGPARPEGRLTFRGRVSRIRGCQARHVESWKCPPTRKAPAGRPRFKRIGGSAL